MEEKLIDIEDIKSVLKEVGIQSEDYNRCMRWTSPKLDQPLTSKHMVLAELTREEEGFLRCMGYVYEEKVVDTIRLEALYETFWNTVRNLHNLPLCNLTVKGGKYVIAM